MSCSSCNCNPCSCEHEVDAANESLASQVTNLTTAVFGEVIKTVVNGQVVWLLPCDLEEGVESFPRNPGEGVACYLMRYFASFVSATQGPVGPAGPQGDVGPQGPAGGLAPGSGYTGSFDVVLNTAFSSPNLLQQKMNLVYVNGLLVSIGTPFNEVVTTAVDCP